MVDDIKRAAWRPAEWRRAVPFSHSQVCEHIKTGVIPSVRIGGARFIVISPEDFLERYRERSAAS